MKMQYTLFNSLHNPQGTRHAGEWADICLMLQNAPAHSNKAAQPLIKLGTFDNDSRGAGQSLATIGGVEIDYDAGQVTAYEAAEALSSSGIESVICSTYTSSDDCPKWRVFAPTSRELPAELRHTLWLHLTAH
jgi:hypothetical protein